MSDDDSAWMDMMDAFPLFEEDEDDGLSRRFIF